MELAKYFDHTILKATTTTEDVNKICSEAKEYGFKSVCINPCHVKLVKELLKDSDVLVCTVIGFPLGANTTIIKIAEATEAIDNGADEIDMVINIGALKEGNYDLVYNEISNLRDATKGKILKVIIETAYLNEDEIIKVSELVTKTGADFIKTSTGFAGEGATFDNVKLMNESTGENVLVKASGGIRTLEDANKMIEAGAMRIGASSSVKIIEEAKK